MKISYELSMPNVGSWNGKWTGETTLYARTRGVFKDKEKQKRLLEIRNFDYDFGDGWRANVRVTLITDNEANKIKRISKGFYGYDWMIDSIEKYERILNSKQQEDEQ